MSLLKHHQSVSPDPEGLMSAISELEKNQKAKIEARRVNNRLALDCPVEVVHGNVSQRNGTTFSGSCRDVSPQGCRLVLKAPITVGDVFMVTIKDPQNRFDPIFGRCVRCLLLREDAFEVGVSFFASLTLSEIQNQRANELDLDLN